MPLSDAQFFETGAARRTRVEVQDDAGGWVDFNASEPASHDDYYAALLVEPRISLGVEDGPDNYVTRVDAITMDNRPFAGSNRGFWHQALPVTLRGSTFSTWYRRKVRIGFDFWFADGTYDDFYPLGTFQIREVRRNRQAATITLSGVHERLMERSAATVKSGAEWYQGIQITALMRRVALAADPSISLDASVSTEALDLGTLTSASASSWGSVPGTLVNGDRPAEQWIPRYPAAHGSDSDLVWWLCDVPGPRPTCDTGIALFRISTGRWTIVRRPGDGLGSDSYLEDGTPVWAYATSTYLYWTAAKIGVYDSAVPWTLTLFRMTIATPGTIAERVATRVYWPAREAMRSIKTGVGWIGGVGWQHEGDTYYYGELAMLPIPQAMHGLSTDEARWWTGVDYLEGSVQGAHDAGAAGNEWSTLPTIETSSRGGKIGAYSVTGQGEGLAFPYKALLSYAMGDTMAPPVQIGDDIYWIGVDDDWQWIIYRIPYAGTTVHSYTAPAVLAGTAPMFESQVSAWSLAPAANGTDPALIFATIEWDESESTDPVWSRTRIHRCRWLPGGEEPDETDTLTIDDPADGATADLARVLVHLFTPRTGTSTAASWSIGVVCNRADISGQSYGLGLWKYTGGALAQITLAMSTGYTGPLSARPFGNFTQSADGTRVYFTDQASGQLWSVTTDLTSVTWTLENQGASVHPTEFCASTIRGLVAGGKVFMAQAPGSSGDITSEVNPWWGQTSSLVRHATGLYPLVEYSTRILDIVDNADMGDLTCWEAITQLRQLAYRYALVVESDGTLALRRRGEGASAGTMVRVEDVGYPVWTSGEIPVLVEGDDYEDNTEIKNAVEVHPYGPIAPAEPTMQPIAAAGSAFGGQYLVQTTKSRALTVAITCVSGGDLLQGDLLWRFQRFAQPVHCYLSVVADPADTTIYVGDLRWKNGRVVSGDQIVRVGDLVTVGSGTQRAITGLPGVYGDSAVTVQLAGGIGIDAPAYTEVTIVPADSMQASDGEDGVTTLSDDVLAADDAVALTDGSAVALGSVLRIDQELLIVARMSTSLSGGDLVWSATVERGCFGTAAADHSTGAAVKAYVYTPQSGRTYPVGDTGVLFGLAPIDSDTAVEARTVAQGDGLLVQTYGVTSEPLESVIVRAVNSASIGNPPESGYGRKDFTVDNRFLAPTPARTLAPDIVAEWAYPKRVIEGVRIDAILPRLKIGLVVTFDGDTFEIVEIHYDLASFRMDCVLRACTVPAMAAPEGGIAESLDSGIM